MTTMPEDDIEADFSRFDEPSGGLSPLAPLKALEFFKRLVPSLETVPERFGPLMQRQAFTLAVNTDLVVLDRIKRAIQDRLETGRAIGTAANTIRQLLEDVGITQTVGGKPVGGAYACFLPGTLVEGDVLAASRARYSGPAVEIETNDGRRLAVTINHPILTASGWKHAGDIQEGDDLICYGDPVESFSQRLSQGRAVDNKHVPARIEDVFQSLFAESPVRLHAQRPVSPLDFHGDAAFFDGDVACVRTNRRRWVGNSNADSRESGGKIGFVLRNITATQSPRHGQCLFDSFGFRSLAAKVHQLSLGDPSCVPVGFGFLVERVPAKLKGGSSASYFHSSRFHAADKRFVGNVKLDREIVTWFAGFVAANRLGKIKRIARMPSPTSGDLPGANSFGLWTEFRPAISKRIGYAANIDAGLFKATDKGSGGDAELARNLLLGFPSRIALRRITNVKRFTWTGHVYDLQTATGFIVSQGIVTSNSMVFRTNMLDAYNAGADEERAEVADTFPVWRYDGVDDGRQGADHKPHFGKYFSADVPFIKVRDSLIVLHGDVVRSPAGGGRPFNCRCTATELTNRQWARLQEQGARLSTI